VNPREHALRGERGGTVPEFVFVTALLLVLALCLVQLTCFLYARNMAMDAASNGARVAAFSDATPADGVARATALAEGALGKASVRSVRVSEAPGAAGEVVNVSVEVMVPVLGLMAGPTSVTATASATRFG
jgi:Flp pilus assembly protein TadG